MPRPRTKAHVYTGSVGVPPLLSKKQRVVSLSDILLRVSLVLVNAMALRKGQFWAESNSEALKRVMSYVTSHLTHCHASTSRSRALIPRPPAPPDAPNMKRVATTDDDEPPQKRLKAVASGLNLRTSDTSVTTETDVNDPFLPARQRKATDVCESGADDEGFVKGCVLMRWNAIAGKLRFIMQVTENGASSQFDVECAGPCLQYLNGAGLTIDIRDDIVLSLRGVKLVDRPNPTGRQLPKVFHYEQGIILKCSNKRIAPPKEVFLDSWAGKWIIFSCAILT